MIDVAEMFGIEPIKIAGFLCRQDAEEIHRLEQQRNRLLEELMNSTIALEGKFFIAQLEEHMESIFPMLPIISKSSQKPEKGSVADLIEKACYRNIELIQEIDPQHRTYGELKELYK